MSMNDELDRLLESYALGKASPADRRRVESPNDPNDKAAIDDGLRFERLLIEAMSLPETRIDVVPPIWNRIAREQLDAQRRSFNPHLASEIVDSALAEGRIKPRGPVVRRRFQPWALARAAAIIGFIAAFYSWVITEPSFQHKKSAAEAARNAKSELAADDSLGAVIYDRYDTLVKTAHAAPPSMSEPVLAGSVISTDETRGAFVRLPRKNGSLVLQPSTQVRVVRGPKQGSIMLLLVRGGVRIDVASTQSVFFRASENGWAEGHASGEAEIFLVRDEESPLPSTFAGSGALVVKCATAGAATVFNRGSSVEVKRDEWAVLGPVSVAKFADIADDGLPDSPPTSWASPKALPKADSDAIAIGNDTISRQQVVREALRVFGAEVVELMVKTMVTQFEIVESKTVVSPDLQAQAEAFVTTDEMLQVAPLRALDAHKERAMQIAALLALAMGPTKGDIQPAIDRSQIRPMCDQAWTRLLPNLSIEWTGDPNGTVFTVNYRRHRVPVTQAEVWQTLQRSLRVAEMETLIQDITRRDIFARWLRERGARFAAPPVPRFAMRDWRQAENVLVRLRGLTRQQARDRQVMIATAAAFAPQVSETEIDTLVTSFASRNEQVVFERIFVPFTEPTQGRLTIDGIAPRDAALVRAKALAVQWRSGQKPPTANDARVGIWGSGLDAGPRPWWGEIFGRGFAEIVLSLGDGDISDPIESPEGFHVVAIVRSQPLGGTRDQQRAFARLVLSVEHAQRFIDELVQKVEVRHVPVDELLRD